MAKDKSMTYWTKEALDERAQRDVDGGRYDPPASWFPFASEPKGTEARDTYDNAHRHHSGRSKK